jgi:WD40 repeat protein
MPKIKSNLLVVKIAIIFIIIGWCANMGFSDSIYTERRLGSMSISSQNSQIAADFFTPGGAPGNIRFWSTENGDLRKIVKLRSRESSRLLTFSHDGSLLGVSFGVYSLGPLDNDVGCYSIRENRWLWKSRWIEDRPSFNKILRYCATSMVFTPDDKKIFAGGEAHLVTYDSRTGEVLEKNRSPYANYPLLIGCDIRTAFSPSSRYFVVWHELTAAHGRWWKRFKVNKWVTVWDTNKNQVVSRWEKPKSEMCPAVFSTDEREIAFGSEDGQIRVYSIPEQKLVREWKAHSRSKDSKGYPFPVIISLALSADGKYLASKGFGDSGDEIKIWDFQKGQLVHEFREVASEINCAAYPMAFSPDGKYFALEQQGKLCLYNTDTWKEKWCVPSSAEGKD